MTTTKLNSKQIFILSLPILTIILVNLLAMAHFKNICLIKLLTHHPCWGCGLTRALAQASRFHFKEAYELNHLIIIVIPLLFFIWIALIKKEIDKKEQ